jgi:hypothetical protein
MHLGVVPAAVEAAGVADVPGELHGCGDVPENGLESVPSFS